MDECSNSIYVMCRKQLYPLGKKNYPTLVQKFFNGSVLWLDVWFHAGRGFTTLITKEAAILAKWLKGVCLGVASMFPHDEHCAQLGKHT